MIPAPIALLMKPPAAVVPDLVSVSNTQTDAVNCTGTNWRCRVSWTTTDSNDAAYRIDIDMAAVPSPSSGDFSSLVTNRTTASISYEEDTGIAGDPGALDSTARRTYRVKLVRRSDSAVIEQMTTSTITETYGPCV